VGAMDFVLLLGRILFGFMFINSGVFGHLVGRKASVPYAQAKGVPLAPIAVPASGLLIILGGLMIMFGVWADLGALFIVAFLVPTASLMHNFWGESDPQSRMMEQVQFFKDLALAGAALMIFVFYAKFGDDLGLHITDSLFTAD
jgi:putative oxidoreductase